jgi:sugar/nucleoside kinase (ribokinase family)
VIALLGNLALDLFPRGPARPGGAPFHAARALRHIDVRAEIYARCARADRNALLPALVSLGSTVHYVPGSSTASFGISEDCGERRMRVLALGDTWLPSDIPALPAAACWIHVAPLLRTDFSAQTLAALGRGRRLSLDGQGLVRPGRLGELELDADYDPELLREVSVLKLSDEEAAVLGDLGALAVPELLVTHGAAGATVYADGQVEEIPADPIGGNHTGTGDAFSIAYVAARSLGAPPIDAARQATAVVAALLAEEP